MKNKLGGIFIFEVVGGVPLPKKIAQNQHRTSRYIPWRVESNRFSVTEILRDRQTHGRTDRHQATLYYKYIVPNLILILFWQCPEARFHLWYKSNYESVRWIAENNCFADIHKLELIANLKREKIRVKSKFMLYHMCTK